MHVRHAGIAALALAALTFAAAGCGGGAPTAAVANVGTTSADSSASSDSSGGGSSGDGSGGSTAKSANGAAFSKCMRSHGVHNFPDPGSGGNLTISPSTGIDPNSATFKAAQQACQRLLQIKPPSPAQQAKMQAQALAFSACMRSHGVPKFPDPTFSGGGARLTLDSRSGLDPNAPQFKAAQKACQGIMPGAKNRSTSGPGGAVGVQAGK